tara:strand:- start:907 stop:1218 length:312 start_codon:yes stop_codon:yes gene_type:complete
MTPAEMARRYRGGASLEVLSATSGLTVPETRAALVAAGETIRGAGRPQSPARSLARALLSQGTPLDVVVARTRLSRAQVLAVRWHAEQRAAARMALAACEVRL